MKLYAYCVVKSDNSESNDMRGLVDRAVYSIGAGEVAALVSDFDGDVMPVSRDNILAHQRVVKKVLERTTPLPFRFGTIVTKAALTSYLEARHDALRQKLTLVDGCVEMSMKVIWQEHANAQDDEPPQNGTKPERGTGTAFLLSKSEQIAGNQRLIKEANEIATWLKGVIGSWVREARFAVRPTHRLVLAADCLVEWSQVDAYRLALQGARDERPDLHFLTSGPWPPYNFANIDLEFKTHFGVS
jgi:hypothetical protein